MTDRSYEIHDRNRTLKVCQSHRMAENKRISTRVSCASTNLKVLLYNFIHCVYMKFYASEIVKQYVIIIVAEPSPVRYRGNIVFYGTFVSANFRDIKLNINNQ